MSLKAFKLTFASDLLSSNVLFLFPNYVHRPHSSLLSRCSRSFLIRVRKDCCGGPWKYSKCEGRSELPLRSVQPHLLSICSVLGTGDPGMYKTEILASGKEDSQC